MLSAKPLRRLARNVRHFPDRRLHFLRHRASKAASARHRQLEQPVLVLCHGNICRSPYAAEVLKRRLSRLGYKGLHVRSAGFDGPGRPPPPNATATAKSKDIDLSAHESQLLTPSMIAEAGLILVMDPHQRRAITREYGRRRRDVVVLGDLDPDPIDTRAIRDPIEQPIVVFEHSYARIDRCIMELVRLLTDSAAK